MGTSKASLRRQKEEKKIFFTAILIYLSILMGVFSTFTILICKETKVSLFANNNSSNDVSIDIPVYKFEKINTELKAESDKEETAEEFSSVKITQTDISDNKESETYKKINSSKQSSLERSIDDLINLTEMEYK